MFARELTDEEMAKLIEVGEQDGASGMIEAFFEMACEEAGVDWANAAEGSVDPKQFQIPSVQWTQLCAAVVSGSAVNGGMAWMNWGPSVMEES